MAAVEGLENVGQAAYNTDDRWWSPNVEFYLCPTVSTVLIHLVKPESTR